MQGTEIDRNEEIRQLAYRIWQEEGCPEGCDVEHWLRAQMIWEEMNRPQSKRKQSKAPKGRKTRQTQTTKREL
jgi:DUF2934 family protein